jgi:histidyl-tRNA synthetase
LAKNPLRILDSKAEADKALVADAPRIDAYMTSEAGAFFEAVQKGLQASGVDFVRADSLVRGFDYYRHTAFEFVTTALGAQGTVIGGGRYDGLIGSMGGPETPAVGWAGGIERLAMLVSGFDTRLNPVAVIPEDEAANGLASEIVGLLRTHGIASEMAYHGNAKRRFEIASKRKSSGRIIVTAWRDKEGQPDRAGVSVRANHEHEAGDPLVEAIVELLKATMDFKSHLNKPIGAQFDGSVVRRTA